MLSDRRLAELKEPFTFAEHGFYLHKPYILKSAIRSRLHLVDPEWSLTEPEVVTVHEDVVVMRGALVISGVKRFGVGTGNILRADSDGVAFTGSKLAAQVAKAYKQAASDILPRAALEFGLGNYLKNKPKEIAEGNFRPWLAALTAPKVWTADDVRAFIDRWKSESLTLDDLKQALRITGGWAEWKGTAAEADAAVDTYIRSKLFTDEPAAAPPAEAPRDPELVYGHTPILESRVKHLAPGDILLQAVRPMRGVPAFIYREVLTPATLRQGTFPYKLRVRDLRTGAESDESWGDNYVNVVAGPKVTAYKADSSLCYFPPHGRLPKWQPKEAVAAGN